MDFSDTRVDNDSWKFRSPCLDAHHEAFILRSSWTVGNLYAANLHLGQSYVKQVKDLEKQRKVWLSRKEKEQETMLRRWKALEIRQARKSHSSDCLSEAKDVRRPASPTAEKFRQRATTVGISSEIAGLEKFEPREEIKHLKNCTSSSQPIETGLIVTFPTKKFSAQDQFGFQKYGKLPRTQSMPNARSMYCSFASSSRSGQSLRRTVSGLPSSIKSPRYFATEPEENLTTNSHLIPRWLPSNLRSKNIRDKSLV